MLVCCSSNRTGSQRSAAQLVMALECSCITTRILSPVPAAAAFAFAFGRPAHPQSQNDQAGVLVGVVVTTMSPIIAGPRCAAASSCASRLAVDDSSGTTEPLDARRRTSGEMMAIRVPVMTAISIIRLRRFSWLGKLLVACARGARLGKSLLPGNQANP